MAWSAARQTGEYRIGGAGRALRRMGAKARALVFRPLITAEVTDGAGCAADRVTDRRLRACDDCGLLLRLPTPAPETECRCPRCDAVLRRHRQSRLATPMALAATSLILCVIVLTTPFLTIRLLGRVRGSTVETGALAFLDDGLWTLSLVVVLTVVLVPLLRLSLRLVVLGGLALRRPPRWLFRPLRWHDPLSAWSMLEVFLFGVLVSYVQLADLAEVQLGPAIYGLGAVVLAMVAADAAFEPQDAWDAMEARGVLAAPVAPVAPTPTPTPTSMASLPWLGCHCCRRVASARPGTPCARCGTPLHHRKPASVSRSWALIAAAAIFYVPANLCTR